MEYPSILSYARFNMFCPINNIKMLFEDEVPEDKGLFTFYREQAEREEEIKRQKKLRKKQKEEAEAEALTHPPPTELPSARNSNLTKHYLLPKTINANR